MKPTAEAKNSQGLVILLSGLTGSKNLPLFKTATAYFLKNNLSVLRLDLCQDKDLKQMTLKLYAEKLREVFKNFDKKYPQIILIGHSFGAIMAIVFLNTYKKYLKKTKLILWEPTLLPWKKEWMEEDFVFNEKTGYYHGKQAKEVINKTFYNECVKTDSLKMLRSLSTEVPTIAAKNSADKDSKKYNPKAVIIDRTDHLFSNKKAQKQLFDQTLLFTTHLDHWSGK